MIREQMSSAFKAFIGSCLTAVFWMGVHPGLSESPVPAFGAAGEDQVSPVVLLDPAGTLAVVLDPSRGGALSSFRMKYHNRWIELLSDSAMDSPARAWLLWPAGVELSSSRPAGRNSATRSCRGECDGFAKSLAWRVISHSADPHGARATLELTDNSRTRAVYPFGFRLDAAYTLTGGMLTIDYTVEASASNVAPMEFSIGDHLSFRLPLVPGSSPAATTFETSGSEWPRSRDVRRGKQRASAFENATALVDVNAGKPLALVDPLDAQPYAVLRDPKGLSVRVTQQTLLQLPEPVTRFRVQGGVGKGYFTQDPWLGDRTRPLARLAAGSSFIWRVQIKPGVPAPDFPKSPGVERVESSLGYVEGPVWTPKGHLLFSDMLQSQIDEITPAGGKAVFRSHTGGSNGNTIDAQGRLYSCERDSRRVVRLENDGHLTVVASKYQGKRLNDPNDVVVRRDGQIYFSDSRPQGSLQHFEIGYPAVYHVDPRGRVSLVAQMTQPNGVALTPDGRTLLIADTAERKIVAFDLDADGAPSSPRVLISGIDGGPDGLRVAANGNIYIACRGIAVYTAEGKFIRLIELPETPSNCSFGDRDLHTLYVTARTSIYRVRVPDKGSMPYGH